MDRLARALGVWMAIAVPAFGQDGSAPPSAPDAAQPDDPAAQQPADAPAADPAPAEPQDPIAAGRAELEALLAAEDSAAAQRWFAKHPDETLLVIDSYLEGALALVEAGKPADDAGLTVEQSFATGKRLGELAGRAFREPMFEEYSAAFAGWDGDEQKRFREGQRLFGEGRKAMTEGNHQEAERLFGESYAMARPLGDWWGMAMALRGHGTALHALGQNEDALLKLMPAVEYYEKLRLRTSELSTRVDLAKVYRALERSRAALGALRDAERQLRDTDPPKLVEAVLTELAQAYEDCGQPEQAERLRERIVKPDQPPATEAPEVPAPAPDPAPEPQPDHGGGDPGTDHPAPEA